jgi:N-acetylmuramoyl-L-alanine amidase
MRISRPRISLLGASNPDFLLQMNGEELETTIGGFFVAYVELEEGDNLFVFENGEAMVELTVIRSIPEPGEPDPIVEYAQPMTAMTPYDNISRFYDRDDDRKMGTPLAAGTHFQIIAGNETFYRLHDGSYVFASNVTGVDSADVNPLYSIELLEKSAQVTIYRFDGEKTVYEIPYEDNSVISGYYARFEDGELQVTLTYKPTALKQATVIIDAGHGGFDPGALGPLGIYGPMEKDLNLYVARKTAEYLESLGINVIFIRDTDDDFRILDRIAFISELSASGDLADLFVSVHANATHMHNDFSAVSGVRNFYTLDQSAPAANRILAHVADRLGQPFVPAIKRNFAVSRYTPGVSMLFEMGYICNPEEYELLIDTDYLDLIAESLGEGIVQYFLQFKSDEDENGEEAEISVVAPVTGEPVITEEISQADEIRSVNPLVYFLTAMLAVLFVLASVIYFIYLVKRKKPIQKGEESNEEPESKEDQDSVHPWPGDGE